MEAFFKPKYSYFQILVIRKIYMLITIGVVLGPSTTFYRPFLKHCNLTNKAVGTIWRTLSNHPQRRQGPDLLIVSQDSISHQT